MKALKLVVICVIVAVVTTISWVIGTLVGNAITQSTPPPPEDMGAAGLAFLAVCAFNSVLVTVLLESTSRFRGIKRGLALIIYVFGIQFLLPQMETFFFASAIKITTGQATAILISGAIVSVVTMIAGMAVYKVMIGFAKESQHFRVSVKKTSSLLVALLALVGYPFLYLTFGYYIAWQNESLRVYYTGSTELASWFHQVSESFSTGVYFFQVLRALIWIAVTVPVAAMLKGRPGIQYAVIGILSALLPTSLLFIPNPFMPWEIAMTHFIETSTSNFVWGALIVWAFNKSQK
jgi:hypothetical protein